MNLGRGKYPETEKTSESVSYRSFLCKLVKFLYVIIGILVFWPVWRFLTYRPREKKKLILSVTGKLGTVIHKEGIYVNVLSSKIMVFSDRCTHLGCVVHYDPETKEFKCPCHGSRFDKMGRRIAGPARLPLEKIPYKKDKKGNLVVWFPVSLEK